MKMAKPSERDIDAAGEMMSLLHQIDRGDYPNLDEDANVPDWFDEDSPEHLRAFYDAVVSTLHKAPGWPGRVIGGMCYVVLYDKNEIVDPASDTLDLHPKIVAALQAAEAAPATVAQGEQADGCAMCNYWHGGTIECRGDGYMWDADDDGWYEDDHSMPCPACNTREYLMDAKENGESISFSSGWSGDYTGQDTWRGGVKVAMRANPLVAPRILRQIGIARPIIDHPTDRAGFIAQFYDHRNERRVVSRNTREGCYMERIKRAGDTGEQADGGVNDE